MQVSADRFGSALCVGSNAVAGPRGRARVAEIPYAEDSHAGLDVRYCGYELIYLRFPGG